MVLEVPTVNWEVGLRWCHVHVEGSSESGGKWLQVITFTCGQCSSNPDEAAQRSENWHENPSGNAVFGCVDWVFGFWVFGCVFQCLGVWTETVQSRREPLETSLRIPVWDSSTGHCCLPLLSVCSAAWDCAWRTPRDASWNTLQINHRLLWHLCLPFLFTLQMKRQKAFLCGTVL